MKVEYEKSMMERLLDAAQDAKLNHKVVRCVKLCESEWDQLYNETEIIVFPTCDHQAKNPIKIYGMRIEYSDQKMSTVNYEYNPTLEEAVIERLQEENAELRREKETLLEMNRKQVGMIKKQTSLKELTNQ